MLRPTGVALLNVHYKIFFAKRTQLAMYGTGTDIKMSDKIPYFQSKPY
jgi:hypothetical protein